MEKKEFDEFVAQFGIQAGSKMKEYATEIETKLNAAFEAKMKGMITPEQFEAYKKEMTEGKLKELNDELVKLQTAAQKQGELMTDMKDQLTQAKANAVGKGLADFFTTTLKDKDGNDSGKTVLQKMLEIRSAGTGSVEFTGAQMKDAGITSISGSVQAMSNPPTSPYLPGLSGTVLELFEIIRDPNYIITKVDLGSTNSFRLAWINETAYEGLPSTNVPEGGDKPLTQHKFKVELSEAKKAAAYIELTEEFDQDVPQLATAVRRMLQQDVMRQFDTQIQTDVIAKARPYNITELNGQIAHANYWSAIRAMIGQIGHYNFSANTIGLNPLTAVIMDEQKNVNGTYLLPPYKDRIQNLITEANKVAFNYALVGDLKQYKVDIYKDFVLKVGWINDNLIQNKFCIVGELRYHSYISDNRRNALVYDNVPAVVDTIDDGSVS